MHFARASLRLCAIAALAATAGAADAATTEKPEAGKQVRFETGRWSGVPQAGPDGQVRQCVLVALRARKAGTGQASTRLSIVIGRGAGLTIAVMDQQLKLGNVMDDQAELQVDGAGIFPAVGFSVSRDAFATHPADAAGFAAALGSARTLTLRSAGAAVDTGAMELELPAAALDWLIECGKTFSIPLDRPTDPAAGAMPAARPRSQAVAAAQPTPAGPPGIDDKQRIDGWDASELRAPDGTVAGCLIRQHYVAGGRRLATFLSVSRAKGLVVMLKDSGLALKEGEALKSTLKLGNRPYSQFVAQAVSKDEVGIFPQHGRAMGAALEGIGRFELKFAGGAYEGPLPPGVLAWLNACTRRNGIDFEPGAR